MKVIKTGIMPRDAYKKRTIAIAKGTYTPKPDEPKIWFESPKSLSQVFNSGLSRQSLNQTPPCNRSTD
ncbi:MAG: hypothetical protein HF973_04840 [Chloroflexi bacterium]|nr:hypothetical protein [Chloroflexota bacterium]